MRHQIYHVKLHTPKPIGALGTGWCLVTRIWVVVVVCVTLHQVFKYAYQCLISGGVLLHLSRLSMSVVLVELQTTNGAMSQTCQRLGRQVERVMGYQLEQLSIAQTGTSKYALRFVTKLQEVGCYFGVITDSGRIVLPGRATRRSSMSPRCVWDMPCLLHDMSCTPRIVKKWSRKKKPGVQKKWSQEKKPGVRTRLRHTQFRVTKLQEVGCCVRAQLRANLFGIPHEESRVGWRSPHNVWGSTCPVHVTSRPWALEVVSPRVEFGGQLLTNVGSVVFHKWRHKI